MTVKLEEVVGRFVLEPRCMYCGSKKWLVAYDTGTKKYVRDTMSTRAYKTFVNSAEAYWWLTENFFKIK